MSAAPIEIDKVEQEAKDFVHSFKSIQLATADDKGIANASYAPFAIDENNCFIIYVSDLSAHTKNLKKKINMSAMLIEAEESAEHIFARKRLTFICEVQSIERGTEEFEIVMGLMGERFGEFINFMKKMKDFHAFRLKPKHANYVRGFAQAYEFENADFNNIKHVNDKGHKNND